MPRHILSLRFADGPLSLDLADEPRCPAMLVALCIAGFEPTHHREAHGLLEWAQCASDGAFLGADAVAREIAHCLACVAPVVGLGQAALLPQGSKPL